MDEDDIEEMNYMNELKLTYRELENPSFDIDTECESSYKYLRKLRDIDVNDELFKASVIEIMKKVMNDKNVSAMTIADTWKRLNRNLQEELKDEFVNCFMQKGQNAIAYMWPATSDLLQNELIKDILKRIYEKYNENNKYKSKMVYLWADTSEKVQENNRELFFEILEQLDGDDEFKIVTLWKETKKQEKYFNEFYKRIMILKNKENADITIADIWKKTGKKLQCEYLEMVLKDNEDERGDIFHVTNESIQEEYYEKKQKENCPENEMIVLYCNLSEKLKKDKQDLFWKYFEKTVKDDPKLAIKLWENMWQEFKDDTFKEVFDKIKEDRKYVIYFLYGSNESKTSNENVRYLLENEKDDISLFTKIFNYYYYSEKNLFEYAMKMQGDDMKKQIDFWRELYYWAQTDNEAWFKRKYAEHKDNVIDILELWCASSDEFQEKNVYVLEDVVKNYKLTKEEVKYLMQNTAKELLTTDMIVKLAQTNIE